MGEKKDRNYWPHGILALIIAVVIGGILSVKTALENPVQESTYFMKTYQSVEDNAYELEKQKDEFDKNFQIIYSIARFKIGKNKFAIKILDKTDHKPVNNADVEMLLTRYETNTLNKKLKPLKVINGTYIFKDLDIQKLGRWKVLTTTKIDKYKGFNSYEVNATRK
ncbi:MAG: hypothetical protein QM482_04105 [Sulfurospirillum sp.]